MHLPLRPYTPPPTIYYYSYNYPPNAFITPPGYWFGTQPYLPYYGYNQPYAYNGMGSGYGSGYGQSVPAPLLASPQAYIPTFTEPIPPQPLIVQETPYGIITRPDPNFQLMIVPRPPNYLTTDSAIYQTPSPYYYGPYPPYYFPPR